jgi:hypothetical protein
MWNNITEWLSYALKNSCGMLGRFRHHQGMFWTPELKAQSKQFKTVINELSLNTATQDGTLRLEKKILFNRYAQNRRKRHEELKRLQFDELCKTGNRGQFFRFVKKLRRPFAASSLNPKNMAQYVDHFKNTFGATPTGSEKHIDDNILEQTDPTKFHPGSESLAFNVEEVQAIVDRLGRNKAAGEDNLPAEAFYFGGDVTTEVLTKFFNILLKFHISPEQWNHSLVCLIYKRKGDASEVKNYRPISLTIVAKRIFEKAIDQLLEVYKSKLHRLQGGFRKRRSTAHQVYYLAELMQSYMEIINVFLDLRAAYDTVDRRILWTLLVKQFGFPLELVRIIRALFDNNKSFLLVGSEKSSGIDNQRGLPQGSALSPIIFNFFINGLIESLEAQEKQGELPSNCLFFADDGNLHATSKQDMQRLLDICQTWAVEYGMTFAPEKSVVVAKEEQALYLGESQLPQVESCKYLGIPFICNGPDWSSAARDMATKAKAVVMALAKCGFNKTDWCPSAKIDVYKLFVRSQMEYGMQAHLYGSSDIQMFEKTQQLALRVAFGVPWNTSKTALKKLSCLESMKCRNLLLNARFVRPIILGQRPLVPASELFHTVLKKRKSLAFKWKLGNPYIARLTHVSDKSLKTVIKEIRYESVVQENFGLTGVSDAIAVHKSLKHSAILYWDGVQDAQVKQELIQWRLGRLAYHQECGRCQGDLSRKHAVLCSGAEDFLLQEFPDLEIPAVHTVIDSLLNTYLLKGSSAIWEALQEAIKGIRRTCLLQLV